MPPLAERSAWGALKRKELDGADLVFLDPDTGIGKETKKQATFSEIGLLRKPKRTIIVISFPHKGMPYKAQLRQLHQRLTDEAQAENIVTLCTNVSVPIEGSRFVVQRPRWFTVIDPDAELTARARAFDAALLSVRRVKARLWTMRREGGGDGLATVTAAATPCR